MVDNDIDIWYSWLADVLTDPLANEPPAELRTVTPKLESLVLRKDLIITDSLE